MRRSLAVLLLALASCARDDAPAVARDADPLALPLAAATRALARGESLDGVRDERRAFPRVERYPWRERATVLMQDDVDRAWWMALERIAKNPRYADLRRTDDPITDRATFSEERLQALERHLGFARDGRLVPLGANAKTKPSVAPTPPAIDEGLEEFAVAGTGAITLRHPETGELPLEKPGGAVVLVLIPGGTLRETDADGNERSSETTVRSFLLAKTEFTQAQRASVPDDSSGGGSSTWAKSNDPWTLDSWRQARDVLERSNLRLPTEAEWKYAARAGDGPSTLGTAELDLSAWYLGNSESRLHAVATRAPNDFGVYDMLGNVAELAGDPGAQDSTAQRPSWDSLTRTLLGGNAADPADRVNASSRIQLVLEDHENSWIGLRPAYDIRPPAERASSAKPEDAPPQSNEPVKKK